MVTAELNDADMFNPSTFAKHDAEKNTSQYEKYMPFIERMIFPISTNEAAWMAERLNSKISFEAI